MDLLNRISQYIQTDAEMEIFLKAGTETRTFPKGEILTQTGTYNQTVFFMVEGLARSFFIEKGKEITTNFYSEGNAFGNIDTIFSGAPAGYTFETLENSVITFCDYRKLEELCEISLPSANFSRFLLGNLMRQMYDRIKTLQHLTAKEKYQKLLKEKPAIVLRAPLGMVATYLGISQETLSRIRSEI